MGSTNLRGIPNRLPTLVQRLPHLHPTGPLSPFTPKLNHVTLLLFNDQKEIRWTRKNQNITMNLEGPTVLGLGMLLNLEDNLNVLI